MGAKKNRALYVKRYLEEQTDENHPVTLADIIDYLAGEGITANRKIIAQDIEQLMEYGVDVVCNRRRQNQYFVGDRHFELPELKLLLDAVHASKFLSAKHSAKLINKLLAFASSHQNLELTEDVYSDHRIKPKYENAYITLDKLISAIRTRKRIQFMYIEYRQDKKRIYKHNRQVYKLSPWTLLWNDDKYYVIGYSESHGKTVTFRVDRIAAPDLTNVDAVPAPEDFVLAEHVKSVFHMYDGEVRDIALKCENSLMKVIIDHFGEDVYRQFADAGHFCAIARISVSKTFFSWVFGMDGAIEIIAPIEMVAEYRAMLGRALPSAVGRF